VVQDSANSEVLMVGFMNRQAFERTLVLAGHPYPK
jgi:phosphoribosyl-AMP cyclohydrolase